MLTDEELKAVDDWRFANRVATRSGAIRQLCKIALEQSAETELLDIVKLIQGSFGGGRVITFSDADIEEINSAIAKAEGRE